MESILTTQNITWQQFFANNNMTADKQTTKRIQGYEAQGYVAVGFGSGMAAVPVLLMDSKTTDLGRFVELYFKNGKKMAVQVEKCSVCGEDETAGPCKSQLCINEKKWACKTCKKSYRYWKDQEGRIDAEINTCATCSKR